MPKLDLDALFTPAHYADPRSVAIVGKAKELAALIQQATPESREQSLALTDVQQALMWALLAIATNESASGVL